ncbi:MAG TPA: RICIN domain-containing protein, partial [Polyangiaceae bacterium]
ATTAKDKHYFRTTGTPSGCSGDSGSPLMERSSGSNLVSGIVSFAQSGETFYTRVSNVRRWLETPSKLNVIANGELGFLMNHDNLFCLSKGGVASDVLSQVCDGRNQPADNHYWKLVTSGSGFQIQNTQDSTCLQALTDSTLVRRATCSSTSASQRWTFVTSGTGRQIRNSSTGTCITGGSGFATVSTCSSASKPQRWSFFP